MKNFLNQLFHRRPRQSQTARRRPALAVERLEDRWTPANLDINAGGVVQLIANPGELNDISLFLNQTTARYEFTDNGAPITVSGTPAVLANADVQGAGTNTVTAKASFLTSITIDTGDGSDFVTIRSTAIPTNVTTTGTGSDNDAVTIGNAGSVQGITAPLSVSNANDLSTLVVDDSADAAARTVTLSDTTIAGLAPADITFAPNSLGDVSPASALTVKGGTGGNTFTVTDLIAGAGNTTDLETGSGNDTVVVQAGTSSSALNVKGQGGNNRFTVTPSATATFTFDSASLLTYRGPGTVNPTGPNAGTITASGFNPVTFTNVTNVLAGAGTLQFSAPLFTVQENGGSAVIIVTRTGGNFGAVSVQFSTSNGTAVAGVDFTATTRTVSFADGDLTPKTVTVPILADPLAEPTETVGLTLSNPTGGATLGMPATAFLDINNVPPLTGDVTNRVSLSLGKLKRGSGNNFKQVLTITNASNQFIMGPLRVVITKLRGPRKHPFVFKVVRNPVPFDEGDNLFGPTESVMVTLKFRASARNQIHFLLKILAG
jgi:hypothetical protein